MQITRALLRPAPFPNICAVNLETGDTKLMTRFTFQHLGLANHITPPQRTQVLTLLLEHCTINIPTVRLSRQKFKQNECIFDLGTDFIIKQLQHIVILI